MTSVREPATKPSRSTILWGAGIYIALLAVGIGIFLWVCQIGETGSTPLLASAPKESKPPTVDLSLHLMATMSAVIGLGYLLGKFLRLFGQPPVIGEVLAGILLGPSFLGSISPTAMEFLLPGPATDPNRIVASAVQGVALLGIVLYMFVIGLELNGKRLRKQVQSVVAISHTSIVLPFVLGSVLALWIYPRVSTPDVSFTGFAMFMGAAMSITAFPVLARILTDRRLEKTPLGTVALGCAAADDVTAWCLLAVVVGVVRSQVSSAAMVLVATLGFMTLMFFVVRPILSAQVRRLDASDRPIAGWVITLTFVMVLLSALVTERIGIHAVFGAFLIGAIIPSDSRLAREITAKLREPVIFLLLPAFFAYTGLKTQLGLVSTPTDILITFVIILVATVGKFVGTLLASRATGGSWALSSALGVLMNTRGLMELIVLHIGLELGIIGPRLFAMMVVMAIVTTLVTSPILRAIVRRNPTEPAFRPE
jgi:Kef-type K+ transport system membrane component KefB